MASTMPATLEMLLDGPALQPPPGIQSNFVDPPTLISVDAAILVIQLVISTLCIGIRMYTKIVLMRSPNREDWVAVAAWVFLMIWFGFTVPTLQAGVGRHQWDVRLKDLSEALWTVMAASATYGIATALIKASILLQYLTIFHVGGQRTFLWWSSWSLIGFLGLFYLVCPFIEFFSCVPYEKAWKPWITEGHCINTLGVNVSSSCVNAAADLIIILLPQPSIWKLNMSRSKKIKTSILFLTAFLALACSLVRIYYAVALLSSSDFTYLFDILGLWSCAEFLITVMCSCSPSLARFTRHVFPTKTISDTPVEGHHVPQGAGNGGTVTKTDTMATWHEVTQTSVSSLESRSVHASTISSAV